MWLAFPFSTGTMALLLFLKAQVPTSPVVHGAARIGIVVLCYSVMSRWLRAHPSIFFREASPADQLKEKPSRPGGAESQNKT